MLRGRSEKRLGIIFLFSLDSLVCVWSELQYVEILKLIFPVYLWAIASKSPVLRWFE